jgi:hypothetical protein
MPIPFTLSVGITQLIDLLPAIAGATVALQFLGRDLPLKHQISSVAVGTLCAIYLTPAFTIWFSIDGTAMHESLEFLVGLFSVAVGREIFREIESGLLEQLRNKFFGGGGS